MPPRLYAVVIGGFVVAKRAVGARADGTYPDPRPNWRPIAEADYRRIGAGWRVQPDGTFLPPEVDEDDPIRPDTPVERLWRKEARLRLELATMRAQIVDLTRRVQALEQQVVRL